MDKQYQINELANIIKSLREENGCPWDKKQTHESLRPCVMEEAAELLAAIRIYGTSGNSENMKEELGDILLQVVMHAQIAKENGLFDLQDVIDGISAKMIRRHPHVFGGQNRQEINVVLQNWEEIKKEEKKTQAWTVSPLRDIPIELPALTRAAKVMKKADALYNCAEGLQNNVLAAKKSLEALSNLTAEKTEGEVERLIGDLLMNISDISRQFNVSQEQILSDTIDSLIERLEPIETLTKA